MPRYRNAPVTVPGGITSNVYQLPTAFIIRHPPRTCWQPTTAPSLTPRLHQDPTVPSRSTQGRKTYQRSCDISTIHRPAAYDLSFSPHATKAIRGCPSSWCRDLLDRCGHNCGPDHEKRPCCRRPFRPTTRTQLCHCDGLTPKVKPSRPEKSSRVPTKEPA
jgi:hypothetical protein